MAYGMLQEYRDPFQGAREQTLRLMQSLLQQSGQGGQRQSDDQQGSIVPPAEAIEDENAYILTLEIPGVDPKDVDVSVVGNSLTIKAERQRRDAQQGEGQGQQGQGQQGQGQQGQRRARHYLISEIQHGVMRREFGLPEDADRNRITAEFRNGLLTLTIAKSQETHQRRKIEITSS